MKELPISRDIWHGDWNYILHPTPNTQHPTHPNPTGLIYYGPLLPNWTAAGLGRGQDKRAARDQQGNC